MEVFIMTLVHYYHYPARLKFRFSQKNYLNQSRIFFFILVHVPSMSILWEEYGKETKNSLYFVFRQVHSLETYSCLFVSSLRSHSVSVTIRILLFTRPWRSSNKISNRHISNLETSRILSTGSITQIFSLVSLIDTDKNTKQTLLRSCLYRDLLSITNCQHF